MSRQMSPVSFNMQRWVAVLITLGLLAVFVVVVIFQDHGRPAKKGEITTKPIEQSAVKPSIEGEQETKEVESGIVELKFTPTFNPK